MNIDLCLPTDTRFLEPLDVLFMRGNKLFGDPGSHGESLVPPWPSVVAGALRARLLADDQTDLAAFSRGDIVHPTLGTPSEPGAFTVTAFHLARRFRDGRVELLVAPPADLVISESATGIHLRRLQPTQLAPTLQASSPLPLVPVLAESQRSKPAGGYWLTQSGWHTYVQGGTPTANELLRTRQLWAIDHRVGIGMEAAQRRAADGRLFSVQAVSLVQRQHDAAAFDVGFLASVQGATLPRDGTVRLGGDGRAAALHACANPEPGVDYTALAAARRCRIVLTTPGLFAEGWRLPGTDEQGHVSLNGVRGRLVCCAVPRAEIISGWNLATRQPKPAQRVAPTGSVYWLEELDATPQALAHLVETGLWTASATSTTRRAEGFNRIALAAA